MDLESYMQAVENTAKSDWITIDGHLFLAASPDSGKTHSQIATLRSNLAISIAIGLEHLTDFKEVWTSNNPDPHASSDFVDFLWNGRPVVRKLGVWVDGGRGFLPVPNPIDLTVSTREIALFRLLNELFGIREFDRYFATAKLVSDERDWP